MIAFSILYRSVCGKSEVFIVPWLQFESADVAGEAEDLRGKTFAHFLRI